MEQRIILVDDDRDDRELFADAFASLRLQAELLLFQNGRELFEQIDRIDRSVLTFMFLDLNMPVISGMEVLKHIRQRSEWDKVFITIYSTSYSEADIESAYHNGAHGYLSKPSSFGKLTSLIAKTLTIATSGKMKPLPKDRFVLNRE
ncbi:response regulator [Pricia sp. S334]|uniref:Response regulator n=1 Tax=Pricia mediterranea TaxID=3076079 RepID=A0ABU3L5B1_9FLAO|nr:response regulator [Pricia sp. S334]MDT7828847.1 response regulator [Pricia sp. S334]